MSPPAISVILPVYNAQDYLEGSIASLLAQDFIDFELLIINDGSTDGSMELAERFQAQDGRVRIVHNPGNLGLIKTLNHALEHAKGTYLARQDSDDMSLPARLGRQYAYMEANPDCVLLGCAPLLMDQHDSVYGSRPVLARDGAIRAMMLMYSPFCGPSVMMRRAAIQEHCLRYDLDMPHAEDYDFYCRLGSLGKMANLPTELYKYRLHGENISAQNLEQQELTASRISYREIKQAGLGRGLGLAEVVLAKKHAHVPGELGLADRRRQIQIVRRLARQSARAFGLSQAEAKAVRREWLRQCSRTIPPQPGPANLALRFLYRLAAL